MLVEVIVVTVVVATIMTSLYILFNRVYNAYDRKSNYIDVDSIYALKMLTDAMIDTRIVVDANERTYEDGTHPLFETSNAEKVDAFVFDWLIAGLNNSNKKYFQLKCDSRIVYDEIFENVVPQCKSIFEEYNINSIYFVQNTKTTLENLKSTVTNETFKEYIDYLINSGIYDINFLGDNKVYAELLLVETHSIKDEDKKNILNKYAYLPTRKIK